jgi:Bacterial regulatory proteins, gntR family
MELCMLRVFIFDLNRSIVLQLDGMGPLYRQIYRAFRNDILTRVLVPGERVPSTRVLADLLKVSRNTRSRSAGNGTPSVADTPGLRS